MRSYFWIESYYNYTLCWLFSSSESCEIVLIDRRPWDQEEPFTSLQFNATSDTTWRTIERIWLRKKLQSWIENLTSILNLLKRKQMGNCGSLKSRRKIGKRYNRDSVWSITWLCYRCKHECAIFYKILYYSAVYFNPWFNWILFLCFNSLLSIILSKKQRKGKFEPRTKLTQNIYRRNSNHPQASFWGTLKNSDVVGLSVSVFDGSFPLENVWLFM